MALGNNAFRTRAASLLSSIQALLGTTNTKNASKTTLTPHAEPTLNEKLSLETAGTALEKSQTSTSGSKTYRSSGDNAVAHDREAQRIVRTIPTWVHTLDEDDEDRFLTSQALLPLSPAQIAHHNITPFARHRIGHPPPGRLHDHEREWIPPLPSGTVTENGSRWRVFASSSAYPGFSAEGGEIVTEGWLQENGADYSQPWGSSAADGDAEKGLAGLLRFRSKRKAWYVRAQRTILRSSVVPFAIRSIVWVFSLIALVLAVEIYDSESDFQCGRLADKACNTSTLMAIVVDACALVYLFYITYDEYSGQPLGLRSAKAKMRLIFLDLIFIVFDSANLSLAFEAVTGHTQMKNPKPPQDYTVAMQKSLASVLLTALIAWLSTFAISVMRLVERVEAR